MMAVHERLLDLARAANIIASVAHQASSEAGWWDDPATGESLRGKRNVPEMLALVHSEVSEALEAFRKGLKDSHLPHRDGMEVEIADAILRLGDLAASLGYNLGAAMAEKVAYNMDRPDHKREARLAGGKRF